MKKVSVVHLVYLGIIAILIMTMVVTFNVVGEESLDQKITFAATFISIIIGALAIFIAVYQGLTQSNSIEKVQEASNRVEKVTKNLEEVSALVDTVGSIRDTLEKANLPDINKKLEQFRMSNVISQDSGKATLTKGNYEYIFLNNHFDVIINYFFQQTQKTGKHFNLYDLFSFLFQGDKSFERTANFAVALDTLVKYYFIKGFEIDLNKQTKIINVPDYFDELIDKHIEKFLDHELKIKVDEYLSSI